MVKSMTGYGRAESSDSGRLISAELRSVNHRYFEFSCRLPRSMNVIEDRIKAYVQSRVSRGKVEMYISAEHNFGEDVTVECNGELAAQYMKAYNQLAAELNIENDITVSDFAKNSEIFSLKRAEQNADELYDEVLPVIASAVDNFIEMRLREGEKLKNDIIDRTVFIEECVAKIEERSPQTVKEHREKIEARIRELIGDVTVDEQRLLTETAIFADKIAVAEETVRLRSHISQIRKMLISDEAVGRKLDFIIQETNREINTIGSKAQDIEIAHIVVDVKAEIEKIREQIQNIE